MVGLEPFNIYLYKIFSMLKFKMVDESQAATTKKYRPAWAMKKPVMFSDSSFKF